MKSPIPCRMSCTVISTAAFRFCRRSKSIRRLSTTTCISSASTLTRILHHEVRHHNEYLAGTDDLGLWDDDRIVDYLRQNGVQPK